MPAFSAAFWTSSKPGPSRRAREDPACRTIALGTRSPKRTREWVPSFWRETQINPSIRSSHAWRDVYERVKASSSAARIEIQRAVANTVATDERTFLLPGEQEGMDRGGRRIRKVRRQAPRPRAPRLLRLAPVRPSVDRPVSALRASRH